MLRGLHARCWVRPREEPDVSIEVLDARLRAYELQSAGLYQESVDAALFALKLAESIDPDWQDADSALDFADLLSCVSLKGLADPLYARALEADRGRDEVWLAFARHRWGDHLLRYGRLCEAVSAFQAVGDGAVNYPHAQAMVASIQERLQNQAASAAARARALQAATEDQLPRVMRILSGAYLESALIELDPYERLATRPQRT